MRIWFGESPTFPLFCKHLTQNNMDLKNEAEPTKKQQVRSVDDCLLGSPRTGSTGVREAQGFLGGIVLMIFLDLGILLPKHTKKVWENTVDGQ